MRKPSRKGQGAGFPIALGTHQPLSEEQIDKLVGGGAGGNNLMSLFVDTPEKAADLSSQVHIRYVERPYKRVLSVMPESYDDM